MVSETEVGDVSSRRENTTCISNRLVFWNRNWLPNNDKLPAFIILAMYFYNKISPSRWTGEERSITLYFGHSNSLFFVLPRDRFIAHTVHKKQNCTSNDIHLIQEDSTLGYPRFSDCKREFLSSRPVTRLLNTDTGRANAWTSY